MQPFGYKTPTSQTDRQRSDSIGRTVLQPVAWKRLFLSCHAPNAVWWPTGFYSFLMPNILVKFQWGYLQQGRGWRPHVE